MEKKEISADIRDFVLANIPSVPHMEALMLLRATQPQRWTAASLAARLYVTREAAAAVLADLTAAAMLECEQEGPAYCYRAGADELNALVDRLAELYATNLVDVTLLIHSTRWRPAR